MRSSSSPGCASHGTAGDNTRAVTEGLAHTGRVVSAAALIMVAALSGLVTGHVAGLQELGAGLALGVLLDATIVRGLLMPSLMALLDAGIGGSRRRLRALSASRSRRSPSARGETLQDSVPRYLTTVIANLNAGR